MNGVNLLRTMHQLSGGGSAGNMLGAELDAERERCRVEQAEIQRLEDLLISTPGAQVGIAPTPTRRAF
jgi:hypothetical protein